MAEGLALRFISGKYQGGEFPLPLDRDVIIGRASDLDMVLVEEMVSRRHAKIDANDGQLSIQDLGSTNGTFVNGEKVQRTLLKEGDRILIGTSILKVIRNSGRVSHTEAKAALAKAGRESHGESAMSGTLQEVPVRELLQLFSTSKRSGVLRVKSDLGDGKVFLREGNLFYASIDDDHDLGPMKALCRVVGWERGQFEFGPLDPNAEFMLELEDSTEALLMEAIRQLDELRRLGPDLPPPEARVALPRPLEPPLTQLKPIELDCLQLAHNHGFVQAIFDRSPATDFETASALLSLLSQGYLEA